MLDRIIINKTNKVIEINDTVAYNVNQIVSFKKLASVVGKTTIHKLEIVTVLGSTTFNFESLKKRDAKYNELKNKFDLG
jgi:hypothetical protein